MKVFGTQTMAARAFDEHLMHGSGSRAFISEMCVWRCDD
jgi:hypothetical protein